MKRPLFFLSYLSLQRSLVPPARSKYDPQECALPECVEYLWEEERQRVQEQRLRHVTIGAARRQIQRRQRRRLLNWLYGQFQSGIEPDALYELFSA